MRYDKRWMALFLVAASTQLPSCAHKSALPSKVEPAQVEQMGDTGLNRLRLTPRAAERLGIGTSPVREEQVGRKAAGVVVGAPLATPHLVGSVSGDGPRKVIPYSAVLYDPHGDTWTYTNPEPLVFVRHHIIVDFIVGDMAVLSDGPPSGTSVVTIGAAELFGTEFKVGH